MGKGLIVVIILALIALVFSRGLPTSPAEPPRDAAVPA